jgi:hypothetical protein
MIKIFSTVQNISKKFVEHTSEKDGLYKIRTEFESIINRMFYCFDNRNLIVRFNGVQKKSKNI